LYFINYLGELTQDNPIVCPTKKFEVESYNAVIDMTLIELSDRFETTNIGPLRDIAFFSSFRIIEMNNDPTMLSKLFYRFMYGLFKINRVCSISEFKYIQFSRNFNEFEIINSPEFLHDQG